MSDERVVVVRQPSRTSTVRSTTTPRLLSAREGPMIGPPVGVETPPATETTLGTIMLAGDLGGTAEAPVVKTSIDPVLLFDNALI